MGRRRGQWVAIGLVLLTTWAISLAPQSLAVSSGQAAAPAPSSFAVVSIKPYDGAERWGAVYHYPFGDRWEAIHTSIRDVIGFAFGLDWAGTRLAGAPRWVGADKYDIYATGARAGGEAGLRAMVRSMLASRFQLKYHWDTKPLPSYALTVASGGARLRVHTGKCPGASAPSPQNPRTGTALCGQVYTSIPGSGACGYCWSQPRNVRANGETMAGFAHWLEGRMRPVGPVDDETGLVGDYDIEFDYYASADHPSSMANLSRALRSSLGLDLSSHLQKHPMKVLVIDQIERPTAN